MDVIERGSWGKFATNAGSSATFPRPCLFEKLEIGQGFGLLRFLFLRIVSGEGFNCRA
jgi:hypothetical protein